MSIIYITQPHGVNTFQREHTNYILHIINLDDATNECQQQAFVAFNANTIIADATTFILLMPIWITIDNHKA